MIFMEWWIKKKNTALYITVPTGGTDVLFWCWHWCWRHWCSARKCNWGLKASYSVLLHTVEWIVQNYIFLWNTTKIFFSCRKTYPVVKWGKLPYLCSLYRPITVLSAFMQAIWVTNMQWNSVKSFVPSRQFSF